MFCKGANELTTIGFVYEEPRCASQSQCIGGLHAISHKCDGYSHIQRVVAYVSHGLDLRTEETYIIGLRESAT